MSQITNSIFIGNADNASDSNWLFENQITHIINCTESLPNYYPTFFIYYRCGWKDSPNQSLFPKLFEALKFIETNVKRNCRILIHCHAGISRSVSVCVAYLMLYHRLPFIVALQEIRKRRSIANPNSGFVQQLQSLEKNNKK